MNDIKPPKKQRPAATPPSQNLGTSARRVVRPKKPQSIASAPPRQTHPKPPQVQQGDTPKSTAPDSVSRTKWYTSWRMVVGMIVGAALLVVASCAIWYLQASRPVAAGVSEKTAISILPGTTPEAIGKQLHDGKLIRSELAFDIYTRLSGTRNKLKAGEYRISPTESLSSVVDQLMRGQSAQFTITFYPGATLYNTTDIDDSKRTDVYTMLRRAGYEDSAIRQAFAQKYNHPLFQDKPEKASLEGYIYGDTYQFAMGTSVEQILTRTFDEMYADIKAHNLIAKYKSRGLNLYQGITLASIVQREVAPADQPAVARVFLNRIKKDMTLGSDVTYEYIADKTGQARDPGLDSPYNTRKYPGLPPGPISAPGEKALLAVASPQHNDYLFFVSGDDGTTHFAKTQAQHEENTRKYCTDLCFFSE